MDQIYVRLRMRMIRVRQIGRYITRKSFQKKKYKILFKVQPARYLVDIGTGNDTWTHLNSLFQVSIIGSPRSVIVFVFPKKFNKNMFLKCIYKRFDPKNADF
jgi:hypothetical protein